MPGRLLEAMSSSPLSAVEDTTTSTNKRRSGRATRKPEVFAETFGSAKRKRAGADEDEDAELEDEEEDDSPSDMEEDEPDEEELKAQRARKPKNAPKKPAAKRVKPNGNAVSLPIRGSTTKARRPKKKGKAAEIVDADEAGGLYAEVFSQGHTLDDVVAEWIKRFNEHESLAVADLINFVLRCAGCDLEVTEHDIEDPDGCTNKLGELQDEFQAQNLSDYPIISKNKGTAAFKSSVTGFFHTLIVALEASEILFVNVELIENIQVWLTTMSAAQNRPFRHTATIVSLSITSALCEIGRDLLIAASKAIRHSESEGKKARANKGRVSALRKEAEHAQQRQQLLDTLVKDWFETVYIHRYRDIDPRIRVDCVQALGDWITTYPDFFFDGSHLRYLGWVLSDAHAPARLEVIKQLLRLYHDKDRLAGLKSFTDRFRARLVEMATLDSEANVRAAAVELLDLFRQAGYLEPDDIDAIGKLIFDAEPRVRKAVVGFFAESVNDSYASKVEELGGEEAIEEDLPESVSSPERPGLEWLRLKCLAEMLDAYDESDSTLLQTSDRGIRRDYYQLQAGMLESRFIVAADSLYAHLPAIREWESLAGFLLYDASDDGQNGASHGVEASLKEMCKLSEKEELVLLEVLSASVKGEVARLVEAASDKKGKKTKKQRDELAEEQERAVRQLASLVPRLLKRFGDAPQTASAVLRLERIVSLDSFEEFHQDTSAYSTLLDDINKQFLTHGNEEVLTEASRALLRAKTYHELEDVTDEKIEELWEETVSTFTSLVGGHELSVRGGLPSSVLDALSKTVARLERLATISRPIEHLETAPTRAKSARKPPAESPKLPLEALIELIQHGVQSPGSYEDSEEGEMEDSLALHAANTVSFYFLWAISEMKNSLESSTGLSDEKLEGLATHRDAYLSGLIAVLEARPTQDDLSITFAELMLDAHTTMATLRQIKPREQGREDFLVLALEMDKSVQRWIVSIFSAAEETFAKRSNRQLEKVTADEKVEAAIDAEPMDEDPLSEPEDEEEEDADEGQDTQASQVRRAEKLQGQLIAEQRLCELTARIVLAVLGGMMDAEVTKKRLERNKTRLGPNFKEVLKHLDTGRAARGSKKVAPKSATRTRNLTAQQNKKSAEVVVEDDDEDEVDAADEDDEEEELRRQGLVEAEEEAQANNDEEEQEQDVESVLGD